MDQKHLHPGPYHQDTMRERIDAAHLTPTEALYLAEWRGGMTHQQIAAKYHVKDAGRTLRLAREKDAGAVPARNLRW